MPAEALPGRPVPARQNGPVTSADDAAWRAARRRVARELHPDLGGDADAYLAALAEVDAAHGRRADGSPAAPPVTVLVSRRRKALRVVLRGARDASRVVRRRLPPGTPGARRYSDL